MEKTTRRYRINTPSVINETIDGEVVIIHLETGNYYSLDRTGAAVWSLIEKNASFDEVIQELDSLYEGVLQGMKDTITEFMSQLLKEGIIVVENCEAPNLTEQEAKLSPKSCGERLTFAPPTLGRYDDMQYLLLLDPIHETDESGWPSRKHDHHS
jgi:hypothetical protein